MDVAFYFKLGFGREGGRDVGLSLDVGFSLGGVFFKMEFCWGVGWFYFDFLGDYILLRGFMFLLLFVY